MNERKVTLTTCLLVNSINDKIPKLKRVKIYVELYVFEIFLCIDFSWFFKVENQLQFVSDRKRKHEQALDNYNKNDTFEFKQI